MFNVTVRKALLFLKFFLLVFLLSATVAVAQDPNSGGQEAKGNNPCSQTDCPASVADPTAAAFATEGYWLMGNIVKQLTLTKFNVLAPLLYLVSAFAGLIMMAMGQPPRAYLWFMLGPAIYNWLLAPDHPVKGVAWEVGTVRQPMRQVWQRAEVGLINNNEVVAQGITVTKNDGPQGQVFMPYPFVWWDEILTGQIQELSKFTGIYRQIAVPSGNNNTNLKEGLSPDDERSWHLLTNSKWTMLENITAASINNGSLREMMIVFYSSECGDKLAIHVNKPAYSSAAYSKGLKLPMSVLTSDETTKGPYTDLSKELKQQVIPPPRALRRLAMDQEYKTAASPINSPYFRTFEDTAFFLPDIDSGLQMIIKDWKHVSCQLMLGLTIAGMRWEAGHAYNHFIREAADHGVRRASVLYDFLYGWEFDQPLTSAQQEQFIINLILLHIYRNEMVMIPNEHNPRWSPAEKSINAAEGYTRTVGSKSKYGELYTWAQLMPYVQGCTMYMIIIAYPFCVVLVVLPGWHKIMFTWGGFYAWVKSWDLGFAIVTSLERSIWAMLGHSEYQKVINDRILTMETFGKVTVNCPNAADNDFGCPVADVTSDPLAMSWDDNMKILDEMMIMAPHLDMDLRNSYYIYIMSALYFAVPAVTGQIFLGAKAGAANMLSGMTQGASAAGEKSGAAYTSEFTNDGKNLEATMGQTLTSKAHRASGLAGKAIDAGNSGMKAGLQAQKLGQKNQAIGQQMQARASSMRGSQANMAYGAALISGGNQMIGAARGIFGFNKAGMSTLPGAGTSSAPSGSSPTTGSSTTGNQGGQVSAPPYMQHYGNGLYAAGQMISKAAERELQHGVGAADAADRRSMVGNNIQQFGHQGRQTGYQEGANRLNQAAQHDAAEAKWGAMRDWSRQVQGAAASRGVFAGTFSAGQRSESIQGLASDGQLGTFTDDKGNTKSAADAFWWGGDTSANGGYMKQVAAAETSLNRSYGANSGRYDYRPASVGAMMNIGYSAAGDQLKSSFTGGENGIISQIRQGASDDAAVQATRNGQGAGAANNRDTYAKNRPIVDAVVGRSRRND